MFDSAPAERRRACRSRMVVGAIGAPTITLTTTPCPGRLPLTLNCPFTSAPPHWPAALLQPCPPTLRQPCPRHPPPTVLKPSSNPPPTLLLHNSSSNPPPTLLQPSSNPPPTLPHNPPPQPSSDPPDTLLSFNPAPACPRPKAASGGCQPLGQCQ